MCNRQVALVHAETINASVCSNSFFSDLAPHAQVANKVGPAIQPPPCVSAHALLCAACRTSKTVIITAVCHYVLLTVVLWPIGLLCRLVRAAATSCISPSQQSSSSSSSTVINYWLA
jgi:hypothetical protein